MNEQLKQLNPKIDQLCTQPLLGNIIKGIYELIKYNKTCIFIDFLGQQNQDHLNYKIIHEIDNSIESIGYIDFTKIISNFKVIINNFENIDKQLNHTWIDIFPQILSQDSFIQKLIMNSNVNMQFEYCGVDNIQIQSNDLYQVPINKQGFVTSKLFSSSDKRNLLSLFKNIIWNYTINEEILNYDQNTKLAYDVLTEFKISPKGIHKLIQGQTLSNLKIKFSEFVLTVRRMIKCYENYSSFWLFPLQGSPSISQGFTRQFCIHGEQDNKGVYISLDKDNQLKHEDNNSINLSDQITINYKNKIEQVNIQNQKFNLITYIFKIQNQVKQSKSVEIISVIQDNFNFTIFIYFDSSEIVNDGYVQVRIVSTNDKQEIIIENTLEILDKQFKQLNIEFELLYHSQQEQNKRFQSNCVFDFDSECENEGREEIINQFIIKHKEIKLNEDDNSINAMSDFNDFK